MEVIVETSRGRQFTVEIGLLDTVLELKKKIQRSQGFSIASQILSCNGEAMSQEDGVLADRYGVAEDSLVRLFVDAELDRPLMLQLFVRVASPPHPESELTLVHDATTQPVLRLRERIGRFLGIPAERFALFLAGGGDDVELRDERVLFEYGVRDHGAVVDLVMRQPRKVKVKVTVVSAATGEKKIPVEVEVRLSDSVGELRSQVRRVHEALDLPLPAEYFFIHNDQNPMADDRTFASYGVKQGDKIEIFRGSIRG